MMYFKGAVKGWLCLFWALKMLRVYEHQLMTAKSRAGMGLRPARLLAFEWLWVQSIGNQEFLEDMGWV